jgi:hypothetical protein
MSGREIAIMRLVYPPKDETRCDKRQDGHRVAVLRASRKKHDSGTAATAKTRHPEQGKLKARAAALIRVSGGTAIAKITEHNLSKSAGR